MVGLQLSNFLESRGISAEVARKVVGCVVLAKYACLAGGLAIGLRYRPLSRVLLARDQVLPPSTWNRHKAKTLQMLEQARRRASAKSRRFLARKALLNAHVVGQAMHESGHRGKVLLWKRQRQLWQHREKQLGSFLAWMSRRYWNAAAKFDAFAQHNAMFRLFCEQIGVQPGRLALGLAEGKLLSMLALPVMLPLSAFLAWRVLGASQSGTLCAEEGMDHHMPMTEAE